VRFPIKVHQVPARLAVGMIFLESGVEKFRADDTAAAAVHSMVSNAYPLLGMIDAKTLTRLVSVGKIALGAALVLPMLPSAVVGIGLAGASTGLLGLYLRIPGMRRERSPRPTPSGFALAKDVWLLGIGLNLVIDAVTSKFRRAASAREPIGSRK
jgi:hypothetical protein